MPTLGDDPHLPSPRAPRRAARTRHNNKGGCGSRVGALLLLVLAASMMPAWVTALLR